MTSPIYNPVSSSLIIGELTHTLGGTQGQIPLVIYESLILTNQLVCF